MRKRREMVAMKKILTLLLLISLCLGGCGLTGGVSGGETVQKTYAELAEIFDRYGIQGISPALTEKMEQDYKNLPPEIELNKAAMLLTALGRGEYDYENVAWTPYENGVYAFDMEVFNVEKMYTDFLTGVSLLNKEELDFKNIREDTSQVDWEEGTGKRTVTFEWENESFTLEAEMNSDWFDLDVAYELNGIIGERGKEKQLFFTGDGYQECIIFYRDQDWAKEFQKETGLELEEFNKS